MKKVKYGFNTFVTMLLLCLTGVLAANPIYNKDIKRCLKMSPKELKEYVNSNPSSPTPYVVLGNRYLNRKEFKKAEEMFLKAKAINVDFRFAYEGLGQIYIEWKRYDEAIKCFEKAIERKSLHFFAYSKLAEIYKVHLNDREKSC